MMEDTGNFHFGGFHGGWWILLLAAIVVMVVLVSRSRKTK